MRKFLNFSLFAFAGSILMGCNQSTPGQNTTDAGTQQSDNTVNSDMENQRTPSDVDTITSPGSNSLDLKGNPSGTTSGSETSASTGSSGAGAVDPNMKGQSDTHGRDTKAGR